MPSNFFKRSFAKKNIVKLGCLLLLSVIALSTHAQEKLELTVEEKKWLVSNPTVSFTGDPNWLPYEAFENNGNYIGIVSEHLELITSISGLEFKMSPSKTWTESTEKAKYGKVDIISETDDSDLSATLTFTNSYISNPIVIAMNIRENYVEGITAIKNKKIATIKDYGYASKIHRAYPDIDFKVVDNIQDGLVSVSTGEIDALLCTLALCSYTIGQLGLNDVKITGKTEFDTKLAFGVQKNKPELVSILNKSIARISAEQQQAILDRWVKQKFIKQTDYTLVYQIVLVAMILIGSIVFWNRRLSGEIELRKATEKALKQAKEDAESASRAKSEFLANMSHEIRTPMNAVIGLTRLALMTDLTAKQQDYLSKVKISAQSLLGIINDILDFSKIEAGKLELEQTDFSLEDVLKEMEALISFQAQEKGIEFLIEQPYNKQYTLRGDPLRLTQILINLLGNAVKFTRKGYVKLSLKTVKESVDEISILFSVKDTGIGLSKDKLQNLFKAFSQADSSTTRRYGGTGLGLTISKTLIELMGGEITVQSEVGKGCEFQFELTFPLQKKPLNHVELKFEGMRVLAVDDNPEVLTILEEMLSAMNITATLVSSGEEAIEAVSNEPPYDLILLDWNMQSMNGIETANAIRKKLENQRQPMMLMVTAYDKEQIRLESKEAGIGGFLTKPITSNKLIREIEHLLNINIDAWQSENDSPPQWWTDGRFEGIKILVAEDNKINQQVAKETLNQAKIEVGLADDGKQALERLKESHFDMLLIDVQMPSMDGYQATLAIREVEQFRNLPIIAMTAHALKEDRARCLAVGMNDYVTKPIDEEQLFSTLAKHFGISNNPGTVLNFDKTQREQKKFPKELPGLHVEAGCKRLSGKKHLYLRNLKAFVAEWQNFDERAIEMLASHDYNKLKDCVHTIKGIAGNLGAYNIEAASKLMEKQLSEKDSLITSFSDSFEQLINNIEVLNECVNKIADKSTKVDMPIESVKVSLVELKKKIECNQYIDQGDYSFIPEFFNENTYKHLVERFEKEINAFEMNKALITFTELVETKGIDLEG